MKQIIVILLTIITVSCQLDAQSPEKKKKDLYPIIENGLWGYIDKTGKEIIEPKFRSAGQFSEGLAPIRLNGTYGYIDKTGNFVIQPQFDIAYSFDQGQAKVYINGEPYYIDKDGKKTFEHNYSEILGFGENDFSIIKTKTENYGVIDKKGKSLVDTIYKEVTPFTNGLAIVTGKNHEPPYTDDEEVEPVFEIGVIRSNGNFIVPFGKYKSISEFINGFAKVELIVEHKKGWYDDTGIIDHEGNLRFIVPAKNWHFDYGNQNFSEGLSIVDIFSVDPDTIKVWGGSNRYTYKGVINSDGKILFSNKNWDEITPFKRNRAFIQDINENWYLIDKKGQILNEEPYKEILYETYNGNPKYLFQNGIQFVQTDKGWGAIDTTGQYIITPRDIDIYYGDLYWRGDIIFTEEDISVESNKYSYKHGFWNTKTNLIVKPQFHNINFSEFTDDLIYVMQDDRIGYIDNQGNYIWREKKKEKQKQDNLNIDYMNRGYFYASSPYKKELSGFGGSGGSGNSFKEISKPKKFKTEKLNLIVNPYEKAKYLEAINGVKLYIANTTKDTLFFDAQDSRIYVKIQAKDLDGEWKDIEYSPSSWCGNSYHSLFLPPNYFWEFVTPVYQGEFKTILRAQLLYKPNRNQKENSIIYSNEFNGSINPGQFWNKQPYYPKGLMDPYNN
jgi:hypothetical protein